jgi:hypothetical protein
VVEKKKARLGPFGWGYGVSLSDKDTLPPPSQQRSIRTLPKKSARF